MKRRSFQRSLAALPLAAALGAMAQPKRPLRVAWVSTERKDLPSQNFAAFRAGLRELGYTEGRDLVIDAWWGEGSRDQVEKMVPDILRAQPDVVLASGGLALGALMRAGVKLPIVFSVSADPVEAKFVQSFARPGGQMTGVSLFTLALVGQTAGNPEGDRARCAARGADRQPAASGRIAGARRRQGGGVQAGAGGALLSGE